MYIAECFTSCLTQA